MSINRIQSEPAFRPGLIALLYLSGMLVATSYFIFTKDNVYFWPCHLAFLAAFCALLATTNAFSLLFSHTFGNWGGLCLLVLLLYYFVAALVYPNRGISSDHLRYFFASIVPGFLLGFVTFGDIRLLRVREFGLLSAGIRRFAAEAPAAMAFLVYIVTSVVILGIFNSFRRADIFLIETLSDDNERTYQLYGAYALMALSVALSMLFNRYARAPATTWRFFVFVGVTGAVISVAAVSLAIVGSNKELVALAVILMLSVFYAKPRNWLFRGVHIRLWSAAWVTLLFLAAAAGLAWMIWTDIDLPALRILAYEDDLSGILEHPSVVSRINILLGPGLDQLSLNPLLGDLGAEHLISGSGTFIHSLISIQSHLGIIGTLTLSGYLAHRLYRLYATPGCESLKTVAPAILFIAAIGTFFTWMPLWFLIGGLLVPRLPYRASAGRRSPGPSYDLVRQGA